MSAEVEDQEARLAAVEERGTGSAAARRPGYGQVLPLTMIVLPKNSGFQIGEMSRVRDVRAR